ncbi:MAG TPA: Spi family protease inhibitor, partial [Prolixibacteraceae bacterium]|nr:Spi family protease inhibitor [Prolixibacteraceae bacterium]
MKVKALLWLLLFFWAIGGYAGEVTKSEAKIVALNWLNGYSSQFFEAKDISRIDILEENEDAFMYLVSFSPKGWVMVSGVDKTEPVLGYSDSSVFDTKKMPVQLKGWLNGLEKELRKAASDDYVPSKDTEDRWRYFKSDNLDIQELKSLQATSAGPLLSTTWDQGQYYNEMAPFDVNSSAGNNHVWIGCVATAMAQVMK